ncbi:hypothetical protein HK105_207024 [Polyrhizophydium stewartii]|uniref:Uncharacterized protein n=1 Tax=Polyrhizophydium stewartii TaxID=2732419 RepID=A0ABR4N1N9_9FUNG
MGGFVADPCFADESQKDRSPGRGSSPDMFTVLVAFNNTQPARDALQYAVDLCQRIQTGYRLLVVYCVALNPKRMLPGIDRLEQALNAEIEAESEKEIAECQRYLQESLNGKVTYEFFAVEGEGETGPVFEKYVKEKHPEANLFVVGSRNNGALKRCVPADMGLDRPVAQQAGACTPVGQSAREGGPAPRSAAVAAKQPSTTTAPTKPPRNQKGRLLNRNDLLDAGGSSSFGRAYFSLCQLHSIPVLTQVMTPALEAHNHLYLDVDRVRRDEEWGPLLRAIHQNRDLAQIFIFSNGSSPADRRAQDKLTTLGPAAAPPDSARGGLRAQKPTRAAQDGAPSTPAGPASSVHRILVHLMGSVRECLLHNQQLTRLELSGLPLRESALALLAKGLFRNQVLQELSLARTEIGDSGLHMLAPAIRTIMHLCVLNLGACRLTERGAHILAALLKSLAVRRQADQWAWSLRLSPGDIQRLESGAVPSQAAPRPLKRLNLCRNSIGDAGCEALLDLVREEVGILALDLQMNGITDRSGMIACGVLSQNVEIVVLDLRNNPIDATLLCAVHQALAVNEKRRPSEHTHVPTSPRAARRAVDASSSMMPRNSEMPWLDGEQPLRDSFHPIGPSIRQFLHTKSSVKKRRAPIERQARLHGNLASSANSMTSRATPQTPDSVHRADASQLARFLFHPSVQRVMAMDPKSSATRYTRQSANSSPQVGARKTGPQVAPTSPAMAALERYLTARSIGSTPGSIRRSPRPASRQSRQSNYNSDHSERLSPLHFLSASAMGDAADAVSHRARLPDSSPQRQSEQPPQIQTAWLPPPPRALPDPHAMTTTDACNSIPIVRIDPGMLGHTEAMPLANAVPQASVQRAIHVPTAVALPAASVGPQPPQDHASTVNDELAARVVELEGMVRAALQQIALVEHQPPPLPPLPPPIAPRAAGPQAQLSRQLPPPRWDSDDWRGMQPMPGIISVAGSSPARDTNGSAPASSLAQSTRQQQQHLDMLIDLMESSLASFHAMLDQMDRREEEHWRRKQERRTHRRTHEKQAT